jgi:signal transduction histidine kinase
MDGGESGPLNSENDDSTKSVANELEHSLTSLLRLSDRLNSIFDLNNLLDALVEHILELTNAERGCAGLRTAEGMACNHFLQVSHGLAVVAELAYDCKPGTGWPGWVLANRIPYLTNEALNDTVIVPEIRERFRVTSGMCIPIVGSQKEVIAFLEVYNKQAGGEFTQQDLKNCLAAAQIASLAIQNGLTFEKLTSLAAFSRSLTLAGDLEQILEVIGHQLKMTFHRAAVVFLPADQMAAEPVLVLRFRTTDFSATAKESEAAIWCWQHGQEAGMDSVGVPDALAHYYPLNVGTRVIGVLGLMARPGAWFSTQQREFLTGFIGQTALAIERGVLEQRVRRLRFLDESDRVQDAILAAVSHEVRAPLAAITAAVSGMLNPTAPLDRAHERQLLETAEYEAKRLHRLMNNLLNVTRMQTGLSRLRLEPCDLSDAVGAALEDLGTSARMRHISIDISPDVPLVPMDFELIKQVLVNLFSNAFKFSSPDQPIHLGGHIVNGKLDVYVADQGQGIPQKDLDRVFEKFHRLAEAGAVDGLGLGLSICKEFIEAHRGRIWLENNPEGGTIARFVLPLQALPPLFADTVTGGH